MILCLHDLSLLVPEIIKRMLNYKKCGAQTESQAERQTGHSDVIPLCHIDYAGNTKIWWNQFALC